MLRRLGTPRWLGALVLAALVAWTCYHLGWWQYHRYEAKAQRNEQLDTHYRAAPVPLASVLSPAGLDRDDEWTRVTVTGQYVGGPVYVRNRPLRNEPGYEVLWALRPSSGGPDVVVNRGWVAESQGGARVLPVVPPAPPGEVEVVGWVRPGQASRNRQLPPGQIASLNLRDAAASLGSSAVLPGYLLLQSETVPGGSSPARPQPLGDPDRDLGPHQAYAYQWWLIMVLGFVLIPFGIRRELRLENPQQYPAKPTKTRIWDEEDE